MISNGFTFGKIIAKSFPEALATVQDKLKEVLSQLSPFFRLTSTTVRLRGYCDH
jgi:hypothetical protein